MGNQQQHQPPPATRGLWQATPSFTRDGAGPGSLPACERKRRPRREEGEEGIRPRKGELRPSPHPCCCKALRIPPPLCLPGPFLQNSRSFSPRVCRARSHAAASQPSRPTAEPPPHGPRSQTPPPPSVPCAVPFSPLDRAGLSFLSSCRRRAPRPAASRRPGAAEQRTPELGLYHRGDQLGDQSQLQQPGFRAARGARA